MKSLDKPDTQESFYLNPDELKIGGKFVEEYDRIIRHMPNYLEQERKRRAGRIPYVYEEHPDGEEFMKIKSKELEEKGR